MRTIKVQQVSTHRSRRWLLILLPATLLLSILSLKGQVTVGTNKAPIAGALLDLKMDGTTNKGLGLPRVALTSLTVSAGKTLAQTIDGNALGDDWKKDEHIGLMVYNVNHCAANPIYERSPIYEGIYIFDGTEWQPLYSDSSPEVKYFDDNRPQLLNAQRYAYRSFGPAGTWMLENMRYLPTDNSIIFALPTKVGGEPSKVKVCLYPVDDDDIRDDESIPPLYWEPEYGLLYTYSAATLGAQDDVNVDQGQGEMDELSGFIQGVCPDGWHIPSDREWNELEKELYNNPTPYSQYTTKDLPFKAVYDPSLGGELSGWQTKWESGSEVNQPPAKIGGLTNRGSTEEGMGHSYVMHAECIPRGTFGWANSLHRGKSLPMKQGGFSVMPVGLYVINNPTPGHRYGYGFRADFWTASLQYEKAWKRGLYFAKSVQRTGTERHSCASVRCKKD